MTIGKTVYCTIAFNPGTTTAAGSGFYTFSLPTAFTGTIAMPAIWNGSPTYQGMTAQAFGAGVVLLIHNSANLYSGAAPAALASGQVITISGFYELP